MADVSNPETPKISSGIVNVDHPALVEGIRMMRRNGVTKTKAVELSGAPYEVVDKIYQEK